MDLFGVQTLQVIATVLAAVLVLLGAVTMVRLLNGRASAGNSPRRGLFLQRMPVAAFAAAGKLRPSDELLNNLSARAPPLIPPRPCSPLLGAPARE